MSQKMFGVSQYFDEYFKKYYFERVKRNQLMEKQKFENKVNVIED